MRLAHRYLVMFLLVVVITGGVLFVTFDTHRSDVTESTEAAVEERAAATAMHLDNQIRDKRQLVQYLSSDPATAAHGSVEQSDRLRSFVELTVFEGVSVVNRSGAIQALVNDGGVQSEMVGESLADRPYVQQALSGEAYISEPFAAETGNQIVVFSVPVRENGTIVGTANAAIHIPTPELFESLSREGDQTVVTVSTANETLYSDADRFNESIDASATLGTVEWTVTAHRDRATVQRTVDNLAFSQGALAVVVLGALLVFGGWVYRSQVQRIGDVVARLRALERREYDSGPAFSGATEWQRIERAFDQLGSALSRREEMLLVLNRILRHNLRNKLNVIRSRTEIIESDLGDAHHEHTAAIREASDDLLELADRARTTETLLDRDRTDARTDVATLSRKRAAAMAAAEPGLDVSVDAPEAAYAVCGIELGTAVDELLENAVEHAGPEPTVTVRIRTEPEYVVLRVEDDGGGIPPEVAAVVSGETDITQLQHTLGIGLWLVGWIVRRYGGELRIPQEAGAPGAVVELVLLRARPSTDSSS